MAATAPLIGSELIDCAKANAKFGVEVACERCGYGSDTAAFERALKQAGEHIGVQIASLKDLDTDTRRPAPTGVEIAPDTPSEL
jgi:hypothetical protein